LVFGVLLYLASPFILAPSFRFPGFLPSSLCGSRRSSARTTHKVIVIFKSCATAGGYNTPPGYNYEGTRVESIIPSVLPSDYTGSHAKNSSAYSLVNHSDQCIEFEIHW
jgi:hypothetical protein